MAHIPREIVARRGDLVLPTWRAMLKFIAATGIVTGPGVRVTQTPNGTLVDADRTFRPWAHPFKVGSDGVTASVREGLMNGVAPFIGQVRIDGTDKDGREAVVPELELKHDGTPITYVAIVLDMPIVDGGAAFIDTPEACRIEHVTKLPRQFEQGGVVPDGTRAIYPLAALYWNARGDLRKRLQIVHHNLGHRYIPGEPARGTVGRHFFWAA